MRGQLRSAQGRRTNSETTPSRRIARREAVPHGVINNVTAIENGTFID